MLRESLIMKFDDDDEIRNETQVKENQIQILD
jgi:hypothetical protein